MLLVVWSVDETVCYLAAKTVASMVVGKAVYSGSLMAVGTAASWDYKWAARLVALWVAL